MEISETGAAELLDRFGLTDSDPELWNTLSDLLLPMVPSVVDEFYEWMKVQDFFLSFFPDGDTLSHVQDKTRNYWKEFFTEVRDDAFMQSRRQIGEIHAQIDLPLDLYMAAMNNVFGHLAKRIVEGAEGLQQANDLLRVLQAHMHLDEMVVADTYSQRTTQKMLEQSQSMIEMSTPVTAIWDGILLLPVVGIVDSARALDITTRVLEMIQSTGAKCFILDISGVAVVDTSVANHFIKITKATRLMGCETLVSGLSPAIAQTMVNLGIDVGSVVTTSSLKEALRCALEKTGMDVVPARRA